MARIRTTPAQLVVPISVWNTAHGRLEPHVRAPHNDASAASPEDQQLHDDADAAAGGRCDRGAGNAEARERTESENEARIEADVDSVRNPQHAHGDRRVTRAAKHGVDQKEHEDYAVEPKNDLRV